MTLLPVDVALYAGALFVLFMTPGPVWLALTARTLSGGFYAAWPLALGVVVGDALWPLVAILGIGWIVSVFAGFLTALSWLATTIFLVMGLLLIRRAERSPASDSRLTRPGAWAGFAAGLAAILGNPKAILFYMGVLPGFFDVGALTTADIAVVVAVSMAVPLIGNLVVALAVGQARRLLTSSAALRRANLTAGALLVGVGVAIPLV